MAAERRQTGVLLVMAGSGLAVGALSAVQARANGSLAAQVGSGFQAAAISFAVGLILLTVVGVTTRRIRQGLSTLARSVREASVPRWIVLGGFSGALFITTQSLSVPVVGVALFSVALVAGQITASLVVDARGWGPRGRQRVSTSRIIAAALGLGGVIVASGGRWEDGPGTLGWVALCLVTGAAVAWQQAANGRATAVTGEPFVAAWINFMLGFALVALVLAILALSGQVQLQAPPSGPPWLYLGGLIGALFLAATAWIVGRIGVLAVSLLVTAGQLTGALLLDLLLTDVVDGHLVAGVLIAFGAVAIGGLGDRRAVRSRSTS
ncbi:MAG: DMT family transporter [Actinobacteria bacterium]|nr:DMT family transporter [Actinomycetota bacterium]